MHIKPITTVSRDEIRDMAHAAAENGEPQHEANPFEPGTTQNTNFATDYLSRQRELEESDA